jgi:hypothetical protein
MERNSSDILSEDKSFPEESISLVEALEVWDDSNKF